MTGKLIKQRKHFLICRQLLSNYEIDITEIALETNSKVPSWIIDKVEVCRGLGNISKHTIDSAIVKRIFIRHSEAPQHTAVYYTDGSKTDQRVGHAYVHNNVPVST